MKPDRSLSVQSPLRSDIPVQRVLGAALMLLWSSWAQATPLGEVLSVSALGDPFRVEISAPGLSHRQAAECLSTQGTRAPKDGIPQVDRLRLAVVGSGNGTRLVVRRNEPVHEPIVQIVLRNHCTSRLERTYTLLLDAPVGASARPPTVAAPSRATAQSPRTATSARTWNTSAGETLSSIAETLYPHDGTLRHAFIETVRRDNPALFPELSAIVRPLPAGLSFALPNPASLTRQASAEPTASRPARARPTDSAPPAAARPAAPRLQPAATPAPAPARAPSASPPEQTVAAVEESPPAADTEPTQPPPARERAARILEQEGRHPGRLMVEGEEDAATVQTLGDLQAANAQEEGGVLTPQEREARLVAALDRSIALQLELLDRLRRLEEMQQGLKSRLDTLQEGAPAATPPPPSAPRTHEPPPVSAASGETPAAPRTMPFDIPDRQDTPVPAPRDDEEHPLVAWSLYAGIVFALFALLLWLRKQWQIRAEMARLQNEGDEVPKKSVTRPPVELAGEPEQRNIELRGEEYSARRHDRSQSRAPHPGWAEGDRLPWDDEPPSQPPPRAAAQPPRATQSIPIDVDLDTLAPIDEAVEETADEHDSAVELADIMVSFGRVQGAAETLADFIRSNPKQAITPWLKLMDVYRLAGMRMEFDALARQLNKTFNVKTVTWDNFDEARKPVKTLEDLPHIARELTRIWGTRTCQAYLEKLLRDNRDGSREGFPISIIDDILALAAILEDELGRYRPDEQTDDDNEGETPDDDGKDSDGQDDNDVAAPPLPDDTAPDREETDALPELPPNQNPNSHSRQAEALPEPFTLPPLDFDIEPTTRASDPGSGQASASTPEHDGSRFVRPRLAGPDEPTVIPDFDIPQPPDNRRY